VLVDEEGIGEAGPVEVAIDLGGKYYFAVAFGHVDDFEGDLGIHDFAVAPIFDGGEAAELPARVINDGVLREAGDEGAGIVIVRRPDVGSDRVG
jgi:hypothetical protein